MFSNVGTLWGWQLSTEDARLKPAKIFFDAKQREKNYEKILIEVYTKIGLLPNLWMNDISLKPS